MAQVSNTQTMTIIRGLTKLKTLDSKIQKVTDKSVFVSQEGKLMKPNEESTHASESYQSITDLIAFRRALKSAIISSNARTTVVINDRKCTVAEAIEEKKSIKHSKHLLSLMKQQYATNLAAVERHNESMRGNLERELSSKRRGEDDKAKVEFSDAYNSNYMDMHGRKLYDPIGVRAKIEQLDNYITNFTEEVDHVLSESNAVTHITLPK